MPAYATGEFAFEQMILDASWTFAALKTALDVANNNTFFVRSIGAIA